jgi:hypothetical protein
MRSIKKTFKSQVNRWLLNHIHIITWLNAKQDRNKLHCNMKFNMLKQNTISNNKSRLVIWIHWKYFWESEIFTGKIFNIWDQIVFCFVFEKCYIDTLYSHTPLYTTYIRMRNEKRKEKMCLCGVHVTTCQIFVWMSRGVLPPKGVYVS